MYFNNNSINVCKQASIACFVSFSSPCIVWVVLLQAITCLILKEIITTNPAMGNFKVFG